MPKFDIPAEDNDSVDSSLLSLDSNEHGSVSNRSSASSVSLGPPLVIERSSRVFNPIIDFPSICREPTLDAVLRKACGDSDLETLTHIQMRVSPNVFGLHQMHIFLPNLVALNLDGSCLTSLRDLGCDLKLKYLNVSRCRLRSFDGISGFDAIEHLVADDNDISSIMQLSVLQELDTLSLRGNKIEQFPAIDFLSTCKKLKILDLTNNVIANTSGYRQRVKSTIPWLLILDGFGFDDSMINANNITECSSSLTSDMSKDSSSLSDRILDSNNMSRGMSSTSPFGTRVSSDYMKRPSTAGSCCSAGKPIVGNIVNKVRRKRGQRVNQNETKTSDSSSTSFS